MIHLTYAVINRPIHSFRFWAGAQKVWESILMNPRVDDILLIVYAVYNREDQLTETQVNDIMWFSVPEAVQEYLGIKL